MTSPADTIRTSSTTSAPRLTPAALATFGVVTLATFAAGSGAPTPLYRVYQDSFALSPLTLTVIFSAYVFALLVSLLTVGKLSDYVGRRPIILGALAVNAVAMLGFLVAEDAT